MWQVDAVRAPKELEAPEKQEHHGKDAMRRLARNDCFVPVILHLNFKLGTTQKLIEEIKFGTLTRHACMSMVLSPLGSWI